MDKQHQQQQAASQPQIQQMAENGFTSAAMEFLATQIPSQKQYLRRINKPLVEKKRRARINNSLQQLKTLVVDALNKTNSPKAKLEKADILEMTVRYVRNLQRQQYASSAAADPDIINKYRAGFNSCVKEVCNFMMSMDKVDPNVKARLLDHLATTIQTNLPSSSPTKTFQAKPSPLKGLQERNVTVNETRGPLQTVQLKAAPASTRREPQQTIPNICSLAMEAEEQQQQLLHAGYQVENVSDVEPDIEDSEPNWKEIMQATFGQESLKLVTDVQAQTLNNEVVDNVQKQTISTGAETTSSSAIRSQVALMMNVADAPQQIFNVQASQQTPKSTKSRRILGSTTCQIISIPPPMKTSVYCDPIPAAKSLKSLPVLQSKDVNATLSPAVVVCSSPDTQLPCINSFTTAAKPNKRVKPVTSRRVAASTVTLSQAQKTPVMTSLTSAAMNAYAAAQPQTIAAMNAAKILPKFIKIKNEKAAEQKMPKTTPLDTLKYNQLLTGYVSKEQANQAKSARIDQLRAQLTTLSNSFPGYQNIIPANMEPNENIDDEDDESVWRPW